MILSVLRVSFALLCVFLLWMLLMGMSFGLICNYEELLPTLAAQNTALMILFGPLILTLYYKTQPRRTP